MFPASPDPDTSGLGRLTSRRRPQAVVVKKKSAGRHHFSDSFYDSFISYFSKTANTYGPAFGIKMNSLIFVLLNPYFFPFPNFYNFLFLKISYLK